MTLSLTAAQRGIYFAHALAPESPAYTTAELVECEGPLDAERLAAALAQAYAENEQLRVRVNAGPDGPVQTVRADGAPPLELPEDDPAEWIARALAEPFDLERGPLARTALWQTPSGARWFHAAHHLALDGFGYLLFARRVAALYRGDAPPTTAPSLAALLADEPEEDAGGSDTVFWHPRLDEMTGGTSLSGRVAAPAPRAVRTVIDLPAATLDALQNAGRAQGLPWTAVAEGAFASYLWRFLRADAEEGQGTVRIGVPQLGRIRPGGRPLLRARAVTTAMNVLPLSLSGDETLTVGEAVARVAAERAAIAPHAERRQEELSRELSRRGGGQLFGPQVNLLPFDARLDFGETRGTIRNLTAGPVEDMTWCLRGSPGRGETVRLEVDANPALYPEGAARAHAERLAHWLAVFADSDAAARVEALPLTTAAEQERILTASTGAVRDYPARTLPQAFREAVRAHPDAIALRTAEGVCTYRELAEQAGALARTLRAHRPTGLTAGPWVVGVALARGADLFAAVYAVQLAGAVYLPLDPEQPAERLHGMIEDAAATAVIASEDVRLPDGIVRVPVGGGSGAVTSPLPPESWQAGLDDPAYVLFTSGSTGRPKGVVVTHRAVDNRLEWMQELFPLGRDDRVAHKTPISFDVSLWELFWPLRQGASVVVVPPGAHRDARALAGIIVAEAVTVVHFVPSLLRAFLADPRAVADARGCLRLLFCSGEALDADAVASSRDLLGVVPVNLYGPTEAAIDVTAWVAEGGVAGVAGAAFAGTADAGFAGSWAADAGPAEVPIGRPVPNTRALVLDAQGRLCPPGMAGELYLSGVQLALGYIGRPELTAAAFPADPFAPEAAPGGRMYRTGDRALWREDGVLLYRGRVDDQLKIRGQRVEPGEVRAALADVAGVAQLDVLPVSAGSGETALACYFSGEQESEEELRERAAQRLSAAMRPQWYVRVGSWPFSPSGKTDRRALATLPLPETETEGMVAARDLREQELCRAMGEVLGTHISPLDDFFSRGGSSLAALRLLPIAEAVIGHPLALADLFAAPTARALAARTAEEGAETSSALAPLLLLRRGSAAEVPLIALPPAGGLGWCYAGMLRHLPPEKPVLALQAEGMDGSAISRPRDLAEWAGRCLALIDAVVPAGRRIDLLGWSIGGMLAQEVAVQAAERGRPLGRIVLMDAYPAEQWADRPAPDEAEGNRGLLRMAGIEPPAGIELTRAEVEEQLSRDGSVFAGMTPATVRASLDSIAASAAIIRASRQRLLAHDVHLFTAAASREDGLDPEGWRAHIRGRVIVHELPVSHGELVREPAIGEIARVFHAA